MCADNNFPEKTDSNFPKKTDNNFPKKILYTLILCSVITTIIWFILFPPVISNHKDLAFTNIELKSLFDNLHTNQVVFSVIATETISLLSKPKPEDILAFAEMPIKDSFFLYSAYSTHYLEPMNKSWAVLEHNDIFYIKQNDQEWVIIESPISTTNPFFHFNIMENNFLETMYRFDNETLYSLHLEERSNNMHFYYLMEIDKLINLPLYLTIVMYNELTTNLEIIQYHFYDWNQSYIDDAIYKHVNNLPGVNRK